MWTSEVAIVFVPLPQECEKAYWAVMAYFAEVMFEQEENLTASIAEVGAVR